MKKILLFVAILYSTTFLQTELHATKSKQNKQLSVSDVATYNSIVHRMLELFEQPNKEKELITIYKEAMKKKIAWALLINQEISSKDTILHIALKRAYHTLTKLILAGISKENLLLVNNQGRTVLHLAYWNSTEEIVTWIRYKQPQLLKMRDQFNKTPLDYAKNNKQESFIKALNG